jgi:hypothetical protein
LVSQDFKKNVLNKLKGDLGNSPLTGCVAIGKTNHITVFVIPGLTRNPFLYQSVTLLDAGSSPA